MRIRVPTEIKVDEYRVARTPARPEQWQAIEAVLRPALTEASERMGIG
jgi:alanine dehydrogenase